MYCFMNEQEQSVIFYGNNFIPCVAEHIILDILIPQI